MEDGPIIMILPSNIEVPIKNTDWSGFISNILIVHWRVPLKNRLPAPSRVDSSRRRLDDESTFRMIPRDQLKRLPCPKANAYVPKSWGTCSQLWWVKSQLFHYILYIYLYYIIYKYTYIIYYNMYTYIIYIIIYIYILNYIYTHLLISLVNLNHHIHTYSNIPNVFQLLCYLYSLAGSIPQMYIIVSDHMNMHPFFLSLSLSLYAYTRENMHTYAQHVIT